MGRVASVNFTDKVRKARPDGNDVSHALLLAYLRCFTDHMFTNVAATPNDRAAYLVDRRNEAPQVLQSDLYPLQRLFDPLEFDG